jgi:putative flippase GtrA
MAIKYIKFVASRLIGTLVDTMVLWGLSSYIFSTYFGHYIVAPTISFEIAVFSNFLLSYYWIWHKRISTKNIKTFITRFAIFNISCVLGFIVKMAFLLLFEKLYGWDVIFCNLAALLISGIVNFVLAEFVVFKKRPSVIEPVNEMESLKNINY